MKTEETLDIFHFCELLIRKLEEGCYRFYLKDLTKEIKHASMERWLRNPLWKYNPVSGVVEFMFPNTNKLWGCTIGLESAIIKLGYNFLANWNRIWCSPLKQEIGAHRHEVTQYICLHVRKQDRGVDADCQFLEELLTSEAALRGCLLVSRPGIGRKPTETIKRNHK